MANVPKNANKIVRRLDGNTTTITVAAMKDAEDLTYAIGFAAHHRLYKMSKASDWYNDEIRAAEAKGVLAAIRAAAFRFEQDVVEPLSGKASGGISNLGQGVVANPYNFVPQG